MTKKKRILVACGGARLTEELVAAKIEAGLKKAHVDAMVSRLSGGELKAEAKKSDLVVTTAHLSESLDVPMMQTVSFITGIGMEKDMQELLALIQ